LKLVTVVEGATKLIVPKVSLQRAEPPTTPVFFNPAASTNRDISVAVTEATAGKTFCDALAGVGARGVRVANEVRRKMQVTILDFNPESLDLAKRSARLNAVASRCSFVGQETNSFLFTRSRREWRFDYVDIDPFGTPAPYIQAAFNAVSDRGLVSVTATDTAVLCGVYPQVAGRRYWATPLNNHFHHETGIRILVNACRRLAASLDIGIVPVAAHSTRHYARVFMRAEVGATKADASMKSEGYVTACTKCGHISARTDAARACQMCGAKARTAGPLWTGKLVDDEVLESALAASKKREFGAAAKTLESLRGMDDFPPYSFSLEAVCSSLKLASVAPAAVSEALSSRGFRSHSQPFEKTGLKTDASYAEVLSAVKEAAG
jgi:tRNA (guanine26-N2/guanine27-N2)-dimethyltransferase